MCFVCFCLFFFTGGCECFLSRALLSSSHYVLSLCHCVTLLCYALDVEQIKMMMKARSTLWFLNRNTAQCSRDIKQYCYHTYVRPQLEYASTVWSPDTKANIDKLEMVQRNAASICQSTQQPNCHDERVSGKVWSNVDS